MDNNIKLIGFLMTIIVFLLSTSTIYLMITGGSLLLILLSTVASILAMKLSFDFKKYIG